MDSKISVVLSAIAVAVISAYAYSLGWLKNFYYYKTFGIQLSELNIAPQDHLVESWFVLENVAFFFILAWFVVKTNRWWAWILLSVYFLLPILSHYAFLVADWRAAHWLINYRHTVLKLVPFAVLILAWIFDRPKIVAASKFSWDWGGYGLVIFIVVMVAWSISTAKHFGSFDANRALCFPHDELTSIQLHVSEAGLARTAPTDQAYLLYASPERYFVWDATGFVYGSPKQVVRVIEVSRDKVTWTEMTKPAQVQPANLFF
jgi:hypothetical protein